MQTQQYNGGLAVTALWEAREGEADTVADILSRFAPKARGEAGVKLFLVHRAVTNPGQFLFYELFEDAAAFAAHQETEHFKAFRVSRSESGCSTRCCETCRTVRREQETPSPLCKRPLSRKAGEAGEGEPSQDVGRS